MATSSINGNNKPKQYFFEQDAVGRKNGTRFLTTHIPTEQVYRNLIESLPFKNDLNDRAKLDDSASDLHSKAGLVVLATPLQVKNREYQKGDRSIVVAPENLPSIISEASSTDIGGVSFNNNSVDVVEDNSALAKASLFKIKLSDSFFSFLNTLYNNLKTDINQLFSDMNSLLTRVTTIETTINNPDYVTNILNEAVPLGVPLPFFGTTPPANYALCNGQQLSRTAYPALFTAIGSAPFATGGSIPNDKFALPDLTDRFLKGPGSEQLGTVGGSKEVTLIQRNLPNHIHEHGSLTTGSNGAHKTIISVGSQVSNGNGSNPGSAIWPNIWGGFDGSYGSSGGSDDGAHSHTIVGETGGMVSYTTQLPVSIQNPFLSCNYIMRLT